MSRAAAGSDLDPSPRWKNSNEISTFVNHRRPGQSWRAAEKVVNGVKTIMVNDPLRFGRLVARPTHTC
jgi:hypothetical protein